MIGENYPADRGTRIPKDDDRTGGCVHLSSLPESIAVIKDNQFRDTPIISAWQYSKFSSASYPDTSEWSDVAFPFSQTPDTLRGRVVGQTCQVGGMQLLAVAGAVLFGVSDLRMPHAYDWDMPMSMTEAAVFAIRSGKYVPVFRQESTSPTGLNRVVDSATFVADRANRVRSQAATRAAAIRAKHWPTDITNAVLSRRIQIGMTAEMVRMAWGQPERINRTTTARGQTEQWVYGSAYVYFSNGKVTAIQDSR